MSEGAGSNGAYLLYGALLGTCVGAVSGWLIARWQMEKEIAREVAGVKQYYSDKASSEAASGEDSDAGERTEAPVAAPHGIRTDGLIITEIGNPRVELVLHPDHPVLEGLEVVRAGEDEDEEDDDQEDDSPPEPVVRDTSKPYVVSPEEFAEENFWTKITVTYYADDEVLVDEREAPIRDTSIIGIGFANHFGELSGDPNVVYIRNEQLTVDFEVIKNTGSYTEIVLGYGKPK